MPRDLDFQRVTVRISNHFEGPNFVNGLAIQDASYTVVSEERARLVFRGGFDPDVTYVQIVSGTGFGFDANGRYTGTVTSYRAFERGSPENGWSFQGLDTSLDRLNTLASDPDVTFEDLLLIPLEYDFVGAQFDDVYICGSFDDIARGFAGDDNFDGLTGHDRLFGHAGRDLLTGGDGDDLLSGGADGDLLSGGWGADELLGGKGRDRLSGGAGSDAIRGGDGDDRLRGGSGDDALRGQDGGDVLHGQSGGDTLLGGAGDDFLLSGGGTNFLFGQRGGDRLTGGGGSDELFGSAGADRLSSGAGADFVIGGTGDDRLSANDLAGAGDKAIDTFIFEAAFGSDVIRDFEIGFDGILLAAGIEPGDVATRTRGDDVIVDVDFLGSQRIVVRDVADLFNAEIDIQIDA